MLRVLHDAPVPGLPVAAPERMLVSAARGARLTAAVAPSLARRTLDLLARLEEHTPDIEELVPSHGDFNVSQLLDVEGALAVLDFDEACLAPRALDVASYAANLVERPPGRPRPRRRRARRAARAATASAPRALPWYLSASLLRRAAEPLPAPQAPLAPAHRVDRRRGRGGARPMKLVMLMSGFPRRSETFALNELLALDRAGMLAAVFATKPGEPGPPQPGAERLMEKVAGARPGHARGAGRGGRGAPERRAGRAPCTATSRTSRPRSLRRPRAAWASRTASASTRVDARKVSRAGLADRAQRRRVRDRVQPRRRRRPARAPARRCSSSRTASTSSASAATPAAAGRGPHDPRRRPARREEGLPGPARRRREGSSPRSACGSSATAPTREALERQIADLGLGDRVELVGPRTHEELPAEYAAAHIVVVPSVIDATGDRDGLPNVVLEAMSSGRPVVASDVAAVRAPSSTARTGLLVAPRDAEALAGALEFLADQPDLRARLGARRPRARRGRLRAAQLHRPPARLPGVRVCLTAGTVAYVLKG